MKALLALLAVAAIFLMPVEAEAQLQMPGPTFQCPPPLIDCGGQERRWNLVNNAIYDDCHGGFGTPGWSPEPWCSSLGGVTITDPYGNFWQYPRPGTVEPNPDYDPDNSESPPNIYTGDEPISTGCILFSECWEAAIWP